MEENLCEIVGSSSYDIYPLPSISDLQKQLEMLQLTYLQLPNDRIQNIIVINDLDTLHRAENILFTNECNEEKLLYVGVDAEWRAVIGKGGVSNTAGAALLQVTYILLIHVHIY
jgi:hypothetical protein